MEWLIGVGRIERGERFVTLDEWLAQTFVCKGCGCSYHPKKYGGGTFCSQECYRNPLRQKCRTYVYLDPDYPRVETRFYNPNSPYVSHYNPKSPFAFHYNPKSPFVSFSRKAPKRGPTPVNPELFDIESLVEHAMTRMRILPDERDEARQELAVALLEGRIPINAKSADLKSVRRAVSQAAENWWKHRSLSSPLGDNGWTFGEAIGVS